MKSTRIAFWRYAVVLAALLVVWADSASAQRFKWWQADHVQKELALTKEQVTRLEEVFQSYLPILRKQKDTVDVA